MTRILGKMRDFVGGLLGRGATAPPDTGEVAETLEPLSAEGLKRWKGRLTRAKNHHQPFWKLADEIKAEYIGRKDPRFTSFLEIADPKAGKPVNFVSSFINTTLPQVLPANPWPIIQPLRGGDEYREGAKRLQARMRQIYERPEVVTELRRAIFDAYCGMGFIMEGWQPNTSRYVGKGDEAEKGKPLPKPDAARTPGGENLKPDEPFLRHVGYRNVRIDPDVDLFKDARWLCVESTKLLADLKAMDKENNPQGLYHDTEKVQAKKGDDKEAGRDPVDAEAEVYTIFERGRRRGEIGILVLAGKGYDEIRHDYVRFGMEGFPVRCCHFFDIGELFPPNPVQFWLDLHDSFNEFIREATVRASQAKKIIIVPDTETQGKIVRADSGDVVVASQDSNMVTQVELGGTTPDTWRAMDMMKTYLDTISGLSDPERGVGGDERKETATKTAIAHAAAATRLTDMQHSVNRVLRLTAKDMGGMLLEHQWQDVPVRISEGGMRHRFEVFNNREVPGDFSAYDFDFDISEQERTNPAILQKRAQDTLALVADPNLHYFAAQEGKRINVTAALEDYLETIGQRDVEHYIEDLPAPEEQQQQQAQQATMENQQMQQTGQPLPVNPQMDWHGVHIEAHEQAIDEPAVAEHTAEHYGYMDIEQAQQMQQGAMQGQQPGMQGQPQPAVHPGPARATPAGIAPQGEAQMAGRVQNPM